MPEEKRTKRAAATPALFGGGLRAESRGLSTLDRAAERLRFGLGDRLASEERVQRILQIGRRHFGSVVRVVVDAAVVQELAVLPDHEDLGGAARVVEVRHLVAGVLQHGEAEAVLLPLRARLL